MINGFGMCNALMLSYTRLPVALAQDGFLPRVVARHNGAGAPWVAIMLCAAGWALAVNLTFERLISIDLVLYGGSLILEFVALAVLRWREPQLVRPFRIPGGTIACVLLGIPRRAGRRLPVCRHSALRLPLHFSARSYTQYKRRGHEIGRLLSRTPAKHGRLPANSPGS
jgi:hypothetical protein